MLRAEIAPLEEQNLPTRVIETSKALGQINFGDALVARKGWIFWQPATDHYFDSRATWILVTSQRRTVLSPLPEASKRPSGVKATDVIWAVWPVRVASSWPAPTSQRFITPGS